jgi:hypothetical protein
MGLFGLRRTRKDVGENDRWSPAMSAALALLKQKMTIECEILEASEKAGGDALLDGLRKRLYEVDARMEPQLVAHAVGRILGMLDVSDSDSVADKIRATTEAELKKKLGG